MDYDYLQTYYYYLLLVGWLVLQSHCVEPSASKHPDICDNVGKKMEKLTQEILAVDLYFVRECHRTMIRDTET